MYLAKGNDNKASWEEELVRKRVSWAFWNRVLESGELHWFLEFHRNQKLLQRGKKESKIDLEGSALSPEELRAIIAQSKEIEGDDCLMCGS